jgi:triacylglycerol esterase/lipase EstA (alpha/beta hydrolase family)
MQARHVLQALLLVQLVAAGAAGYVIARVLHTGFITGLCTGAIALVLVRLAISANNFRMSARAGSVTPPEHVIGPRAALRLFVQEFIASMHFSSWVMPRAVPHLRVHAGASTLPVLLLHGYGCNSGYWCHLTHLLDGARISHATLDLAPVTASIDAYVPQVEEGVQALLAATGAGQVIVVAHSMGGLVARAWLRDAGSARVARVITLGTPHQGTTLASFGIGANAREMRRDGVWLQRLAASEDGPTRALITSIYTHHDNIVAPQTSSELDGARNLAFGGMGHVALGADPVILGAVLEEVRRVRTPR